MGKDTYEKISLSYIVFCKFSKFNTQQISELQRLTQLDGLGF